MGDDTLLIPFLQEKNLISRNTTTDTSDSDGTIIIAKMTIGRYVIRKLSKEINMPDFNLIELLEQAPMGKAIISYYNNKNCLNDCFRNKLVDIIMRHLFPYHCKQYNNFYCYM